MAYPIYGRGCSAPQTFCALRGCVVDMHAVLSSFLFPGFSSWTSSALPFTLLSTACGLPHAFYPHTASFLSFLAPYLMVYSSTGYGFSFRLTPFLLREKCFVVKLCVLRIFMRYPSLFFPYTHLAVRKEERLLVVLGCSIWGSSEVRR